jgi:sporulation protein YlmC with PRC-barrel domain
VLTTEQARDVIGATAYSRDGEKIGRVAELYLDDATEQPEWITVSTGLLSSRQTLVPLAEADLEGDRVVVPYSKEQVKDAPQVDVDDGHLSDEEEVELYRYYGLDAATRPTRPAEPVEPPAAAEPAPRFAAGTSGTIEDAATDLPAAETSGQEPQTRPGRLRRFVSGERDEPVQ